MEKGNEEAKKKLIESNLRLVLFLVKKYETVDLGLDLINIGTVGLIKAINTYKVEKNTKFSSYASRCIENEILMALRKIKRDQCVVSFEDIISYDNQGNELHLEDLLGTDADLITKVLEDEIDKKLLYEAINSLNEKEKQIIILRYGLFGNTKLTQKEVARKFSISRSNISKIEAKILKKLKHLITTKNHIYDKKEVLYNMDKKIKFNNFTAKEILSKLKILGFTELEINILKYRFGIDEENNRKYDIEEISSILAISPKKVIEIGIRVMEKLMKKHCLYLLKGYLPQKNNKDKSISNKNINHMPKEKELIGLSKNEETYKPGKIETVEPTGYEKKLTLEKQDINNNVAKTKQDIILTYKDESKTKNTAATIVGESINKSEEKMKREAQEMKKQRKIKTIYELLPYSKERIDSLINNKLIYKEKVLLELRYGKDLENPETSPQWSEEHSKLFHNSLIPRMKKMLSDPDFERKKSKSEEWSIIENGISNVSGSSNETSKEQDLNEIVLDDLEQKQIKENQTVQDDKKEETIIPVNLKEIKNKVEIKKQSIQEVVENKKDDISKEDCMKILEIFNSDEYKKLTSTKEPLEAFIISLVCGHINGNYYSINAIANFLQMDISKVYEIAKKGLNEFRNILNHQIDMAIKQIESDNYNPVKSIGSLKGNNVED